MKIMLKWIAICSNMILILMYLYFVATQVAKYGMPRIEDIFYAVLLLVPPTSSLAALLSSLKGDEGWLSLYFKRKALEEKLKIEKLRDQQNQTSASKKD